MSDTQITIKLTSDEALVLSDWLDKLQMTDLGRVIDDPAVWSPIHRIAGTLDKSLPELFAADYGRRLDAARQRLRAENLNRLSQARATRAVVLRVHLPIPAIAGPPVTPLEIVQ